MRTGSSSRPLIVDDIERARAALDALPLPEASNRAPARSALARTSPAAPAAPAPLVVVDEPTLVAIVRAVVRALGPPRRRRRRARRAA